jgi:hypothetical protein
VRLSVPMSGIVQIYRSPVLLGWVAARPTRKGSGGAAGWGFQRGAASAREGDSTQLIPLDDERGEEQWARSVRARQLCTVRSVARSGAREASQVRYFKSRCTGEAQNEELSASP